MDRERSIKYERVRNTEINAVRSLVECETLDTNCNEKLLHFVRIERK